MGEAAGVYRIYCFDAGEADSGQRLDVFLAGESPELSRSHIQKLVAGGMVEVNGTPAKASCRLRAGDSVVLRVPPPVELVVDPEPISLDVYYEDCVIGGPGAFVIPIRRRDQFKEATRTKLVLEIAGRQPPVRALPAQLRPPRVSCTIGEQMWRERWGN